ncbi:MAG: phenylacetate--CoA ligase family protein [Chloroflexi bacterium]|nr:phenylacetate--CoA ligase family protein [Chloroflexota bacterium]MCY3582854.1 phenylacetate--CoA ligase family protein [Chloroflexota bacterium]MCY3715529.1 phenylacetate--CoA ligase family protein [Chloroflexota bacterium]MDE2650262.1 phenylacetate--CoA ligase family protein [Chloroflexota bacterium]MXV93162.1 phenylacetate--CoA ligase [Chloroflexota bacterium]
MAAIDAQIHDLVQHSYQGAPAIRQLLDAAGVAPGEVQGADDLAKIPVLQKDALVEIHQQNPPFGGFLTIDPADLPRIYISPGPIYDPQPPPANPEAQLAPLRYIGIGRGDRVLNTFMYHLTPAGILLDEAIRACGGTVIPSGPGNTELQIMLMMALGATSFVGQPSYLMTLLDKAAEMGIDAAAVPLKKALFSAEPYTANQQARLEGEYGLRATSAYGTADLGFIGYTVAGEPGFRILPSIYLQVCDPQTGEPLPAGETGEIVATTFNKAYPLIRFGTGDLGALAPQRAGEAQRLLGIFGRSGDAIKVRGMFLHPNQLSAAVMRFPQIKDLQAIITRAGSRDIVTLHVALRDGASADGVAEGLTALAQHAARLRIDQVKFVHAIDPNAHKIDDRREWD